jgi:hypothetical protein
VYRAQTGLTQCYNCQQFGNVWTNFKQPPRCVWCGGCHLHKECPERGNTASIPTCCNCKLVDGEEADPSNYRGCRHAKEEIRKIKSQRAPKTTMGRMFSSNHSTPRLSFAVVLCSNSSSLNSPQLHTPAPLPLGHNQQQVPSQSVQAPNANNSSLNDMFKVVAKIFQQIMTELNGAESE